MANITKITHGQANWDETLNLDLDIVAHYTADTGWISLPLKNTEVPVGGSYLRFRIVGPFIAIRTQFMVSSAGTINIADIPTNVLGDGEGWRYFTGFAINSTQGIQFFINDHHTLSVKVPENSINTQLNCDMVIMAGAS